MMDLSKKKYIKKFGVVFTWPGAHRMNAEREVILRIKKAAEECGYEAVVIDNHGHILNELMEPTEKIITSPYFVISMHFDTPKAIDAFYYYAIWNPPEFPLRESWGSVVDRYISFDDYLFPLRGGVPENHLRSILITNQRNMEDFLVFAPSVPSGMVLDSNLSAPQLFYCGVNWDAVVYGRARNEGLMKLLDESGCIKIFGPTKLNDWGGISPWEGYKCYQSSIPFDGFSILKEINKCGVCLAISSDIHRRSGIATNRIFEACAAGAVIISDDNRMVEEMFGNSVLYVKFNRNDPKDTYQQIMRHYEWIIHNREKAKEKALQSQEIFLKKYSLNIFLNNIVKNHPNRCKALAESLFAKKEDKTVLVMHVCNTLSLEQARIYVDKVASNVKHQQYKNIVLVVGVDKSIFDYLSALYVNEKDKMILVPLGIYDSYGARNLTDGEVITFLRNSVEHDYFIETNSDEVWFYDHVTTMVRCFEEDSELDVVYSGQVYCNLKGDREVIPFHKECIWQMLYKDNRVNSPREAVFPYPGCFIFSSECHEVMPDYVFDYLDGQEYIAYLYMLYFNKRSKFGFSKRVTFQYGDSYIEKHHLLINSNMEYQFILGLIKYDLLSINMPAFDLEKIYSVNEDIYIRYIFPWKVVPAGASVIIYGGGKVGKIFLKQLVRTNYCRVVAVCDKNPKQTGISDCPVISLSELYAYDSERYDAIVIAVNSEVISKEIRSDLVKNGIHDSKIKWENPNKMSGKVNIPK